jgi:hypothetical protein
MKFNGVDRVVEPVPCARCGGTGWEPDPTDLPAALAGQHHLRDLAQQLAANPRARRLASEALAELVGQTPPDGEAIIDDPWETG